MRLRKHIRKIVIGSLFLMGVQLAFAAFTFSGITEKKAKDSKYSLKNLGNLSSKSVSYSSLKYALQFKGTQTLKAQPGDNSGTEVVSMLRYDDGNKTYIYPYKFKVKVPKFKTPAPDHR